MLSVADRGLAAVNRLLARVDAAVVRRSSSRSGNAAPSHFASARVDRSAPSDDHTLVHELRTECLASMPPGASTVLSAGCAGEWYFDWLDRAYRGIEQHIGLEAYLPEPPGLPARIRWVPSTVRRMVGVADRSVDLVFSGQNIEHLWAADVVGFLLESRRVLRDGAWLVIDSPNAWICEAINYRMPEHVAEFTPVEMTELLRLAGFGDITVKGVWLCFDRDRQLLLPLAPNRILADWTAARRRELAANRPADSFIWWAEARASGLPDIPGLVARTDEIVGDRYRRRLANPTAPRGRLAGRGDRRWVSVERGSPGLVLGGPHAPLPPGRHRLGFEIRRGDATTSDQVLARLQVVSAPDRRVRASRELTAAEIGFEHFTTVELLLEIGAAAFDVEFQVHTTGASPLTVRLAVDVDLQPSDPFHAGDFDRD